MTALTALAGTETRLLTREWAAMVFAFVFPPLFFVVLAGVFGSEASPEWGGATPSDYYVAAYVGVPVGALALVGLPVMLASYRERDVLRRFEAFGVARATVVAAQALVTCGLVVLGAALVIAVAAPTYGVPAVHNPLAVVSGFAVGTVTMVLLGVVLGLATPTARSAQALGLMVFLPMWLLGGGGPPQPAMSDAMAQISDVLPLWHATAAIREPWLGTGEAGSHLIALAGWAAVAASVAAVLLRRRRS